jgi:hypothetical protein
MLFSGCGSKQIPDWTNAAFNQLDAYKKGDLAGNTFIADLHFKKATEEIKKSGNLEILARAYLTKYAVRVAVLEKIDDREYLAIEKIQPSAANRNFHEFLKGNFDHVDQDLLPEQYHGFLTAFRSRKEDSLADELLKIEDPLSRLIAAGLLVRLDRYDERCLQIAIETASKNGWKKALLVYLETIQKYYEKKKEPEKAANTRKKIDLIKN